MNTISQVEEANKASTLVESDENVGVSNENVYNGQEGLHDDYNGSPSARSRYGRIIRPKSSSNDATNSLQVDALHMFHAFIYSMRLCNINFIVQYYIIFLASVKRSKCTIYLYICIYVWNMCLNV